MQFSQNVLHSIWILSRLPTLKVWCAHNKQDFWLQLACKPKHRTQLVHAKISRKREKEKGKEINVKGQPAKGWGCRERRRRGREMWSTWTSKLALCLKWANRKLVVKVAVTSTINTQREYQTKPNRTEPNRVVPNVSWRQCKDAESSEKKRILI